MYERRYQTPVLKQEELLKPRRRFPWRTLITTLVILIICGGIVYLIKMPQLQVRNIVVSGTNVVGPDDVSAFITKELEGKYFSYLPKTSMLLVQGDNLARRVVGAFPRFKSADVDRTNFNSLTVDVVEYPGVYLWCTEGTTECSFMDERGEVFAAAPYFSGSAYRKIFVGTKGEYPFRPITDEQISIVKNLIEKLQTIPIEPIEFHFISNRQLIVAFAHNGNSVKIFFDPSRSIDDQLAVLYTGINTEPFALQYRDKSKVLEYIDLRFSNKIVYKFL